ncbi:MAG: extracellular solute-binding protein [Clostridia bacterium]|nr:extracellular solute-binding protein [Clostridia bacterium]
MKKVLAFVLAIMMLLSLVSVATAEEKPLAGQSITVLYMSSVYADAARALAPEFEEATGCAVEVVDFPYLTLHERALLDLTSGGEAAFDVINVASQWDGEFYPFLTDLGPYIERDDYDMTVWIENILNNAGLWNDTYIGIPNNCTPQVFAYRTDIFPDGLPDNWADYTQACIDATTDEIYGCTISEISGQLGGVFDYRLWSAGGNWADSDWNVTINSDISREQLELLYKLNKEAMDPANLAWGTDESIQAFLDGRAAVCETWPTLGLIQAADDPEQSKVVGKWALSTIPYEETGITLLSAWDLAIPANSSNKEAAWEWIKAFTEEETQQRFYEEFGFFTPRKSFWEQDSIKNSPLYELRTALDTANMWWRIAASVEADTVINTVVSSYLSDQITIDETLVLLEEGLQEALLNSPPDEGIKNLNH